MATQPYPNCPAGPGHFGSGVVIDCATFGGDRPANKMTKNQQKVRKILQLLVIDCATFGGDRPANKMTKNQQKVRKILQLLTEVRFLANKLEDIDEESERSISQLLYKLGATVSNLTPSSVRRESHDVKHD